MEQEKEIFWHIKKNNFKINLKMFLKIQKILEKKIWKYKNILKVYF